MKKPQVMGFNYDTLPFFTFTDYTNAFQQYSIVMLMSGLNVEFK